MVADSADLYDWSDGDIEPEYDMYRREDDLFEWLESLSTGELSLNDQGEPIAFVGWIPVNNIPISVRYMFADRDDLEELHG